MQPSRELSRLIEIMAALRNPETGCPWDLAQDFKSLKPYAIEEAYEVADAIDREDFEDLCDELGDLLLQPVFHAQLAAESRLFDMGDVVLAITTKLIRRHPHIFGGTKADDPHAVKKQWDDIKKEERALKEQKRIRMGQPAQPTSALDDVPGSLPALPKAQKLDKRAAAVGFDWPDAKAVLNKCREEISEVSEALETQDKTKVSEEIGDLLFAVASLARHANIDAETALYDANLKFERRFKYVESRCVQDDVDITQAGIEKLDGYWNEIRKADKIDKSN